MNRVPIRQSPMASVMMAMAVDSPPGKIRPSTPATSSLTLISLVAAPNLCKTSMCSSTCPARLIRR